MLQGRHSVVAHITAVIARDLIQRRGDQHMCQALVMRSC